MKPLAASCEALEKHLGSMLGSSRRALKMIVLKTFAVAIGASILFTMYSGDLAPDIVLAIIACFR